MQVARTRVKKGMPVFGLKYSFFATALETLAILDYGSVGQHKSNYDGVRPAAGWGGPQGFPADIFLLQIRILALLTSLSKCVFIMTPR